MVEFVGVRQMARIVEQVGIETVLTRMARYLEADFTRWDEFERTPRLASHSPGEVETLDLVTAPTDGRDLFGLIATPMAQARAA